MFDDLAFIQELLRSRPIVLTSALAALPLIVAVALAVTAPLRRRARRKPATQRAEAAPDPAEAPAAEVAASTPPAVETSFDAPEAVDEPIDEPAEMSVMESAEKTDKGEEAPAHIQQILSNVFEDDATTARYEALLDGLDDIAMADLSAACRQVAERLG